jgi:hypothetical protein
MDIFAQLAEKIIKEQEAIIGPVAYEQAKKVEGLEITDSGKVTINGKAKEVLTQLVKQYEKLFGRTSVEVCREAVKSIISKAPKDEVPQILL